MVQNDSLAVHAGKNLKRIIKEHGHTVLSAAGGTDGTVCLQLPLADALGV